MDLSEKFSHHSEKVERIAGQIIENTRDNNKITLEKSTVSHTVPGANDRKLGAKKLNIKDLTEILLIDTENNLCIAESGVTFSQVVRETLKYNLIPLCVSELKDITIGGAVSGCSVESMSYKYGGFHDTCIAYEIITGTGEILTVTKEKNNDIFEMMHGSFGTLGIITMLTFKLMPAKPYVRMDYIKFTDLKSYQKSIFRHYKAKDVDFMDGIIHSPTEFILCIGTLTNTAPYTNTYLLNIFYKSTISRKRDYIPIYDYFFRYDADCHWIARNFHLENKFLRTLVSPIILGSRNILKLGEKFPMLAEPSNGPDLIVDVFIPISKLEEFWKWYLREFDYFPVWIVPYHIDEFYPWINPDHLKGVNEHLFIDFAIYGFQQPYDGRNYYEILENKVKEIHGIKTLITHNYYNERDFWEIHNKSKYDEIKKVVDPQNLFKNLYDKMVKRKQPKQELNLSIS